MTTEPILQVKGLRTHFLSRTRPPVKAVDGISYDVRAGEMMAIVGESGCGKSIGILSLMRLNPPTSTIVDGEVLWCGRNILKLSKNELYSFRGKEMAMIFQNPLSSLNPIMTIGNQVSEGFMIHQRLSKEESWQESEKILESVAVPDVKSKMNAYPFELSGGMRQRVMVALALSCRPKLLIADEPTTALDATTQAQLLELMVTANKEAGRATILVTHDLGIVARYADRVNIMYAGHIVEQAACDELYRNPLHPYTIALLTAVPRLDRADDYELAPIRGYPPRLDRLGPGCPFQPRCDRAVKRCIEERPSLKRYGDHSVACWQVQDQV
jgi:oligopeptide/dipeptide ABC transporter ATP-binding protein